jgi:hypothetical protein
LYDYWLTERHPHGLGEDARQGIRRPTGRERHDHDDLPRGIVLCSSGADKRQTGTEAKDYAL